MESYITYEYYTDTYKGSVIPSTSFDRVGLKASYQIDLFILGKDFTNYNGVDYTDNVKMATCSIAEILYNQDTFTNNSIGGAVTSESIGDYSRSFSNQEQITAETKKRIDRELSTYLGMTGLLYRGIRNV